ncbi:MAG: hypothetical protein IT242_03365 [Bacteroidia bacterium]|nr:hypothetical protein [Bacteroidia bacterium]
MRLLSVFLPVLLFWLRAGAQPYIDLFGIGFYKCQPSNALITGKNPITHTSFRVSAQIPVRLDSNLLAIGPVYERQEIRYPGDSLTSLVSYFATIAYLHTWKNSRWQTLAGIIPRVARVLSPNTGSNTFQPGFVILNTIKVRDALKYKFGVYYNQEFFGAFIMPLAGIDWRINSRWNLFGVLPGNLILEYKWKNSVYTGLCLYTITSSFRAAGDTYIRLNDNRIKAFMDFYITKTQVLSLEAGHTGSRSLKTGWKTGDRKNTTDLSPGDGWFFRIGYAFRIRMDEKPAMH